MPPKDLTRFSKFLSLILRHKPAEVGMTLDPAGWIDVAELLDAINRHGQPMTRTMLDLIVADNDKKRFEFSEDGSRIRASQGHSVEVDLGYAPATPPDMLYHGTVARFLDSIRKIGLVKGKRHHVHLSADTATAEKVGDRRGDAVILQIDAAAMHRDGLLFYISTNGVWLTDAVPAQYIQFPN